jgi:hypothetical protein
LVPYLLGPATGGVMTRAELVEALTIERFTHHQRADTTPTPSTPLPVDNPVEELGEAP